ncbi:MAG TPA: PIN domain-containing protein [Acidimicrobiales bacterium]|nr:PIN domain-containing protein [Acidimicrobiales bacterium]
MTGGEQAVAAWRAVLSRVDLVRVNDPILGQAGTMSPAELRSVDAIHLATAARIGTDLAEIVTYDRRMAAAARSMGYKVSSPT